MSDEEYIGGAASFIARYTRAILYAAESHGHDLRKICGEAGVNPDAIAPNVTSISAEVFSRLSRAIKRALNDDFCGFTPSPCRAGTIPFICETIVREETLGLGLERAFRFYAFLTQDLTFGLSEDGEIATFTVTLAHPEFDRFHYLQEWWLILWLKLSTWLIGEEIPVLGVDLPHEPIGKSDEYVELFKSPCRFSQPVARIQFPARVMKRRIVRSMDDLGHGFLTKRVDLASASGIHQSWTTLIKTKMKECLYKTERLLSIEDLAREFDMSSQTLRRRLEDEGMNFRSLKNDVRREVVLKWLSEPGVPIGEISLRAGFAEHNGLVRAVRSWVGASPKEYRAQMIAQAARGPCARPRARSAWTAAPSVKEAAVTVDPDRVRRRDRRIG